MCFCWFFFSGAATTEIYTYVHTLSLHDPLPISAECRVPARRRDVVARDTPAVGQAPPLHRCGRKSRLGTCRRRGAGAEARGVPPHPRDATRFGPRQRAQLSGTARALVADAHRLPSRRRCRAKRLAGTARARRQVNDNAGAGGALHLSFRTRDRPWETTRRSASLQRRATPARPACSPNPYRSNPTVPRRSTNLSATGSSAAAG